MEESKMKASKLYFLACIPVVLLVLACLVLSMKSETFLAVGGLIFILYLFAGIILLMFKEKYYAFVIAFVFALVINTVNDQLNIDLPIIYIFFFVSMAAMIIVLAYFTYKRIHYDINQIRNKK